MHEIASFILAVTVLGTHFGVTLARPETLDDKLIDGVATVALIATLPTAYVMLTIGERWGLLLILTAVTYGSIGAFMATVPLRVWTVACSMVGAVIVMLALQP